MAWIKSDKGGWMSLQGWLDLNFPNGSGLFWASECCGPEELLEPELGLRVVNEMCALAIDGWGNLMDQCYAEYVENETNV